MSMVPALETGPLGKVGTRRAGSEGRLGLFLDFFTLPSSHLPLLTTLSLSEASLAEGRCLLPGALPPHRTPLGPAAWPP